MPNDIAKDLIRLAADMARATGLPSEFDDDHLPDRPRIYWLNCLSRTVDALRVYALRVRAGADEIESLRSRLTDEQERRARLEARRFDQGSPSVFDALRKARERLAAADALLRDVREDYARAMNEAQIAADVGCNLTELGVKMSMWINKIARIDAHLARKP
jgi:hypothetical protein